MLYENIPPVDINLNSGNKPNNTIQYQNIQYSNPSSYNYGGDEYNAGFEVIEQNGDGVNGRYLENNNGDAEYQYNKRMNFINDNDNGYSYHNIGDDMDRFE